MNEQRYRAAEHEIWERNGAAQRERWLELADAGARVRVLEVGEGPPVLFVHGGSNGASSWAALAARLPKFRCILLDRPGCGLSGPLRERLTAATLPSLAASLVAEVLDALEIERAHLVATSFGSYYALHTAAAHPRRIDRMVLLGWPIGESSRMSGFIRASSVPGVGRLMAAIPANDRAAKMIFRSLGHGPSVKDGRISAGDIAWFASLLRDTDTMKNELAGRSILGPFRGFNPKLVFDDAMLSSVAAPTLFLWGENDPFGGPDVARRFAARLPNAQLTLIPRAGHAPWLDEIELCASEAGTFLADAVANG